jgi:hypothetical protein
MSIWKQTMDRRVLLDRARAALQSLGHPYVHSTKTIRGLIIQQVGNEHLQDAPLIELFLQSMATQIPSANKLVLNRLYKPDRAMQLAAKRCATHPRQIGVN